VTAVGAPSEFAIAQGDLIVGVNGQKVTSAPRAAAAFESASPGSVPVEVRRGSSEMSVYAQK